MGTNNSDYIDNWISYAGGQTLDGLSETICIRSNLGTARYSLNITFNSDVTPNRMHHSCCRVFFNANGTLMFVDNAEDPDAAMIVYPTASIKYFSYKRIEEDEIDGTE